MTPVYIHPTVLHNPARIQQLERRTGMRVVTGTAHPQLVRAIHAPARTTGQFEPDGPRAA